MNTTRPVALDLFCGAGGMSLGMERAGFDVVLGVDYDGYHAAAHERNFPYGRSLCGSVYELDNKQIAQLLPKGVSEIDLIFGGPPCQGFSNMGLRDTQDPRNSLIFHFARLIKSIRPKAFVMENVPGLNMGATTALFDAFLGEASTDYNVTLPVRVLNAIDFGVPQARRRLFVLGVRKDLGSSISYPTQCEERSPTVIEAIGDLPEIELHDALFKSDLAPDGIPPQDTLSDYARRARGLLLTPNDFGHERLWDRSFISGWLRTRHTPEAAKLYRSTAPGSVVPGHKLPRLSSVGHCPTLRAGANSEHGSHTAPRPIHPLQPRVITAREAARLHGYPDWFSFYPSKLHAYRQIGNSVCPPVAHAVGLEVMKAIGVDPSKLERKKIELHNDFVLPANSPTQHSRIPVKVEYPKIINYLWQNAFDEKTGQIIKPHFDADDIRDAIAAANANLPRVRPERFLYEASQQRAIRDILAQPLSKGYSVVIIDKDTGKGAFQRASLSGSLGLAKAVAIKSSDLKSAVALPVTKTNLDSPRHLADLIEQSSFASDLSRGLWSRVLFKRDLLGDPIQHPMSVTLEIAGANSSVIPVVLFEAPSVSYDQILKSFRKESAKEALIIMKLTKSHFAGCYVTLEDESVTEQFRKVFCV